MKKLSCALVLLSISVGLVHPAVQFRLAVDFAAHLDSSSLAFADLAQLYQQSDVHYGGHWELLLGRLGFGIHGLTHLTASDYAPSALGTVSWDGSGFLSYHLFGAGAPLDPYLQIGFGCAGAVSAGGDAEIADPRFGPDSWGQLDSSAYHWSSCDPVLEGLALYPHLGAGVALDLDGLLLGATLMFQPFPIAIPTLGAYELADFKLSIFGGIALGGHR